ncbi:hypothetical protein K461DRAFT_100 [Myriangium duriaei CBS 260.36]|uniref:Uncharacterized protein n=1 Tax=Myriangium duriaei CBS 260.36 TaxID=1168546 RepID=A0A9P4J871_9PEZI|nr:hypothetical protein K461DRAFT_100 [Myriangium duriaei CBS 260.36]
MIGEAQEPSWVGQAAHRLAVSCHRPSCQTCCLSDNLDLSGVPLPQHRRNEHNKFDRHWSRRRQDRTFEQCRGHTIDDRAQICADTGIVRLENLPRRIGNNSQSTKQRWGNCYSRHHSVISQSIRRTRNSGRTILDPTLTLSASDSFYQLDSLRLLNARPPPRSCPASPGSCSERFKLRQRQSKRRNKLSADSIQFTRSSAMLDSGPGLDSD